MLNLRKTMDYPKKVLTPARRESCVPHTSPAPEGYSNLQLVQVTRHVNYRCYRCLFVNHVPDPLNRCSGRIVISVLKCLSEFLSVM